MATVNIENKPAQHTASEDPYAMLRAQIPALHDLTKETFSSHMSRVAAYCRSVDAVREDRILNDPYAQALGGEAGKAFVEFFASSKDPRDGIACSVLRHVVMDDEIEQKLDPEIHQVVLIGAGLDTRAYRLEALADCHVFELDSCKQQADEKAEILKNMNAKLIPRDHDVIITDLAQYTWPEELITHGFNPSKPTLWIAEGLLMYLDEASVDRLMATIDRLSAPKSHALMEMIGTGLADMDIVADGDGLKWHAETTQKEHKNGVLRALPWNIEMLLHRTSEAEYAGRRWNPTRFARYIIPKENIVIGPWFVASCIKPTKA